MWFRTPEGRMKPWTGSDLNFESGTKIGGQISVVENAIAVAQQILNPFDPTTPEADWFDREASANVVDVSKWNGDIFWDRLWEKADGCIGRLGYGAIRDQRFNDNIMPGLLAGGEDKYKALYHYMNTGVNLRMQIDVILEAIQDIGVDNIHAFWTDVEGYYNDMSSPDFYNNPLAIMRAVRSEYPELLIGFYTNRNGWNALSALGNPKPWLQEFLFWYAWYPFNPQLRYPSPPPGLTMADIYLWQYWCGGNNMGDYYGADGAHIDMNVSRDQLAEFLIENLHNYDGGGGIIMPDPNKELQMRNEQELLLAATKKHSDNIINIALSIETPVDPEALYEATVTSALKVRTGPGTGYPQVDTLVAGEVVSVWKEQDGSGYTWAKISETEALWVATNWLRKS